MRNSLALAFTKPRLVQIGLDLTVSMLAFWCAYFLRFEGQIPWDYFSQYLHLFVIVLILRFFSRFPLGLHRQLWRYVSLRESLDIALAITLGSLSLLLLSKLVFHTHLPWGVLALDWGINVLGYVGLRAFRRLYAERQPRTNLHQEQRTRVLLVGAGQAGNLFARELLWRSPEIHLVGFVDDDASKLHGRVQGIEVIGRTVDIPQLVAKHGIAEVILCIPAATRAQHRQILNLCHEAKVKVKTMPALKDLIAGKIEFSHIREVGIEDLLGRAPVAFDRAATSSYLGGQIVMVTGAGGSIGSELCRQIATLNPARLILLGRGEFSIYDIELELRGSFPRLDIVSYIADVRDYRRMERIFAECTPNVIFHTAAHKHVPLMEKNPGEAVLNNIFGTRNVAELANQFEAEAFVLISTDKAVNPTNVMGASKRAAEMVVQELSTRSETRFMCVRFGNVLGSRGSVVPIFKRQIAAGGPITITHPDIIRFFMTIPEASQLVLQAGALGTAGEIFVLDMGEPVKIVDLARDLIKLSGLEPDIDIRIEFTGLRPGEKLYEEILTAEEGITSTTYQKIFRTRSETIDRHALEQGLAFLQSAALAGDEVTVRRGLKMLVQTYQYQPPEEQAPLTSAMGSQS